MCVRWGNDCSSIRVGTGLLLAKSEAIGMEASACFEQGAFYPLVLSGSAAVVD